MTWLRKLFSFREQHESDAEKPFLDHLEDLRVTLMKMGGVLVFSMIVAFCFKNQLTRLLEKPLGAVNRHAEVAEPVKAPGGEPDPALVQAISISVSAAEKVSGNKLSSEDHAALAREILQEYQEKGLVPGASATLTRPVGTSDLEKLQTLDITESFTIALKLAFYAGIVISFPFLLYFVIGFVLPALTRREKRLMLPGILAGSLLFAGGVLIGFQYILPKTLVWFHDFGSSMGFIANWKAGTYFSFVTQLCIACGLLCELPLIMVVLSVLNVISFALLQNTRRHAIAVILVLVAIIAPTPDPITFITLAIPMLLIFEGSIWIVWLIERRRLRQSLE